MSRKWCAKQCGRPRWRINLCYRCFHASALERCGHPLCNRPVEDDYCGLHDVGLDFRAGDWFDWVAAERLWRGELDGRKPTVPELRTVLRIAEQRGVSYNELARRIGVDDDRMLSWRHMLERLPDEVPA